MLSKHDFGSKVLFNPTIVCVAERMSHRTKIDSGSDYLDLAKAYFRQGRIPYEMDDIVTETIAGFPFDILTVRFDIGFCSMEQKCYAAKIKDYILLFVVTYASEEDEKQLKEILNTLKFSN